MVGVPDRPQAALRLRRTFAAGFRHFQYNGGQGTFRLGQRVLRGTEGILEKFDDLWVSTDLFSVYVSHTDTSIGRRVNSIV